MRESVIERYLHRCVREHGGDTRKFVSPGRRHAPDRIVLFPFGCLYFIEMKALGEKPRAGQVREHKRLRKLGFTVLVLDTKIKVDRFVESVTRRKV